MPPGLFVYALNIHGGHSIWSAGDKVKKKTWRLSRGLQSSWVQYITPIASDNNGIFIMGVLSNFKYRSYWLDTFSSIRPDHFAITIFWKTLEKVLDTLKGCFMWRQTIILTLQLLAVMQLNRQAASIIEVYQCLKSVNFSNPILVAKRVYSFLFFTCYDNPRWFLWRKQTSKHTESG